MKSFIHDDDDCPGFLLETRGVDKGKLLCSGTNSACHIQRFAIFVHFNEPFKTMYDTVHFEWRIPLNAKKLDHDIDPEILGYKMISPLTVQFLMRLSGGYSVVWEYQRHGRMVSFIYLDSVGTEKLDLSAAVYENPGDYDRMKFEKETKKWLSTDFWVEPLD